MAFDLGIKTLAVGYNGRGRFYHIGGFKGYRWHNKQLDKLRSRRDRCQKKSRRYIHLSQVYQRVSERKRNKRKDCLHKASHLISHKLVESTVVVGDLSQRQMVTKEHTEHQKGAASGGVQRLGSVPVCPDARRTNAFWLGRRWSMSTNAIARSGAVGAGTSSPCRSTSGPIAARTAGWSWTVTRTVRSTIISGSLPGSGPHTGDPVRCAAVFTATDNV